MFNASKTVSILNNIVKNIIGIYYISRRIILIIRLRK